MKRVLAILLFLSLLCMCATAEGFFPSPDALFGQAMPSLTSALGRQPDEVVDADNGRQVTYRDFTAQDYVTFSRYLGGTGCVVESVDVKAGVLTAVISKGDVKITFIYDDMSATASVLYPSGTRMEDAKQDAASNGELLPDYLQSFGTGLPSMAPVVSVAPKQGKSEDGGVRYTYSDVSEAQYDAFSCYLTACGCALDAFETRDGVATASLSLGNASFSFAYNSHTRTASIDYPAFSFVKDADASKVSADALLPLADEAFGVLMPRIALATGLQSDGLIETKDGFEETYQNFTDADYAQFSAYLQEKGCVVSDYSTDTSGVLTINLTRADVPFTFIYDRARSSATVRYTANSRPEPEATPEPTAVPASTQKPQATARPVSLFSESECWKTAEAYFRNMSWKNPKSLTIYGHTSSLDLNNDTFEYTFIIDYSAQNGFGGNNRSNGIVIVNAKTNKVTAAWAN